MLHNQTLRIFLGTSITLQSCADERTWPDKHSS